jgi:AcrR family transcriptional regulator
MRATTRAVRSDGVRSRREILHAATRLATVRGIGRLSIGDLAAEVGMSKSGLYAHFGSKEELQLATVATAREIFDEAVIAPAGPVPLGRDGVVALSDAFVEHLRERVFPGGCFFHAAAADLHGYPGPVRDAVVASQVDWQKRIRAHLEAAQAAGDLPADDDPEQVLFDVIAFQAFAHVRFTMADDESAIDRARSAVRVRLGLPADSPSPLGDPPRNAPSSVRSQ